MTAVMLVGRNHCERIEQCLYSLANSDCPIDHLYYWDNGSTDRSVGVVRSFGDKRRIPVTVGQSPHNLGIVIPKLRLLNLIKDHGKFQHVLDIHSDMLFPRGWWGGLTEDTNFWLDPLVAVAYPSLLQSAKPPSGMELEALVVKYSDQKAYKILDPIQTQPVLFKLGLAEKIGGYVDAAYSPMYVDDDDFRYRVYASGYTAVGSGLSWVYHQGGLQSAGSEALGDRETQSLLNRNLRIFEARHHISVSEFKSKILHGVHPIVQLDTFD